MSAAAAARAPAGWARQGAESLAAALKIVSDLTAQEIALVVGMVRERVSLRPAPGMVETAGRVVTGLTGTGKILLDLAAGETGVIVEGIKDGLRLRPSMAALADMVPRGLGVFIDMHKEFLDAIGEQTEELVAAYGDDEPFNAASRMARMTRERLESFIEAQKKFLDVVTEQVNVATETGKATRVPAAPDRMKVMTELAREGVGKFIEAQRQVLDLAVEQMEASTKTRAKEPPKTSLAELTRRSVENFTSAQKTLLDLVARPVVGAEQERPKAAAPRRARPRKRAAAAKAE